MFPTFIDLAVAMNQQDMERESVKAQRLADLPSETYGQSMRRWAGSAIASVKTVLGRSDARDKGIEGQSSTQSFA